MSLVTVTPTGSPTWARETRPSLYGGEPDKTHSIEATHPYAWTVYLELMGARGSAYSKQKRGAVHVENIAIARHKGALYRLAEKFKANSLPGTSHERLQYWVHVLKVIAAPTDEASDVRARCAARYQAAIGPSRLAVDKALRTLLGDTFVRTWHNEGDELAVPPEPTHWPVVSPGLASYNLGDEVAHGPWLSARQHLLVEVVVPQGIPARTFLSTMHVQLFALLDAMLPSTWTFNWAVGLSGDGFELDLSDMDYVGFGFGP